MSKDNFNALIKDVTDGFTYVKDENDCSDFVRRLAEKAPEYGLEITVRVFDTNRGRHAAAEYVDDAGERWMGDVIYGQAVRLAEYQQRLDTVGLW